MHSRFWKKHNSLQIYKYETDIILIGISFISQFISGWPDFVKYFDTILKRPIRIWASLWENQVFAYAKTKTQISCAVTAKLISAFVFAT